MALPTQIYRNVVYEVCNMGPQGLTCYFGGHHVPYYV